MNQDNPIPPKEVPKIQTPQSQSDAAMRIVESTNKLISDSLPNAKYVSELALSVSKALSPAIESISGAAFANVAKAMTDTLRPVIDQNLFSSIARERAELVQRIIKPFNDTWAKQFSELTKNLGQLVRRNYPTNWRADEALLIPENLEVLILEEGLPLAWVPPTHVLKKLFDAKSAAERRRILYANRKSILGLCLDELKSIKKRELRWYTESMVESIGSIQSERWKASQALSTNIIDSMMRNLFDKDSRIEITSHKNGRVIDWKHFPLREALVFGGIWGSYADYHPDDKGKGIPKKYTRHATAHAASREQYSKINSLIATMHAVALIKLIDSYY